MWDEISVLELEIGARATADILAENAIIPELRETVLLRRLADATESERKAEEVALEGLYIGLKGAAEVENTYEITGVAKDGRLEAELIWPEMKGKNTSWILPRSLVSWVWNPDNDKLSVTTSEIRDIMGRGK